VFGRVREAARVDTMRDRETFYTAGRNPEATT
jgi:hypothetical protein